jgi:UDP-4-amino-4-deoxy-L-arabinose formyltransferase/UDP-glucuronic acid dehydrogenase (UDP-4-keto-hexauronic acid decarboxylating)
LNTVVFGYHLMGCVGLEALVRNGFEVKALFTHRDNEGEEVWWPSAARKAVELGIPVRYAEESTETTCESAGPKNGKKGDEKPSTRELLGRVARYQPDMLFSFYYRDLLPQEVLDLAVRGGFNLHGSLLPDGRGRAPVNWTLVRGLEQTGVTLHQMVARADAGAIVDREAVAVDQLDTAYTLYRKLAVAGEVLLDRCLPALKQGTAQSRPMDLEAGTYFGRRRPEDGRLDWQRPARDLYNLIRAVTHPYPGAFSTWKGKPLQIWWAFPLEEDLPGFDPGQVTRVGIEGIDITTGDGLLRITTVQFEGEPEMPACAFALQEGIKTGAHLS